MKKFIVFSLLWFAKYFRSALSESEQTYKLLFLPGYEKTRWKIGKWKAWKTFEIARKNTPAYQDFIQKNMPTRIRMSGLDPDLTVIPATDKESYVKKYSIESRCVGGKIPTQGVVVDESSGTSGTPNNWVRGFKERAAVKYALQIALHTLVGKDPVYILNAFALGPWATGMNVSMSLVDVAILKSTGPDIKKIENTLNFFGPKYHYIICGYPPFFKSLVDEAKVDWSKYNIIAFYGGEGISEGMRKYLTKAFKKIYGSYGASDLEINIAAENDFTVSLRNKIAENKELYKKIVKHAGLPMIFQYNPLDYYIETNNDGELLVTLCRQTNVAPKIRYNIHDLGHVLRFPELKEALIEVGLSLEDIGKPLTDLPLLFHYGRADMAVAFFGAKITPSDIEEVVFQMPKLAKKIKSFSLITEEDDQFNKHFILALEMNEDEKIDLPIEEVREQIFEKLKSANQDYREVSKMVPEALRPKLEVYDSGTGPFAVNDIRLKSHYIQKR